MKRFTYFESAESRIRINVRLCHWSIVSGVHGKIQRDELYVAGLHRTIYRLTSWLRSKCIRITDGFLNVLCEEVFPEFFKRLASVLTKASCPHSESNYFFLRPSEKKSSLDP
jgi:hypothetical protein